MAVEVSLLERDGDGGESGQSIIEFMIMVPVILALTVLMLRANTVIQVSIVNQKYARAQALFLAYNSPYYPERHFLNDTKGMVKLKTNQLIIGVSNKVAPSSDDESQDFDPEPIIYRITRPGAPIGNNSDPEVSEGDGRGRVRVRSSVALCTPLVVVGVGGDFVEYTPGSLANSVTFPFCRSQFSESEGGGAP